jgi:hypothetical protein
MTLDCEIIDNEYFQFVFLKALYEKDFFQKNVLKHSVIKIL